MTRTADALARIADDLAETDGVTVRLREDAHMEPRRETVTEVERDTRVVQSGGGVTTETVEREVEKTRVVGEKKVVSDRWLDVTVTDIGKVACLATAVEKAGVAHEEAVTSVDVSGDEKEYEVRT